MKTRLKLLLTALAIAPLLVSGIAAAEGSNSGTSGSGSSSDSTQTTTTSSTDDDKPLTEQQRTELTTRLAERKTELKTKLTTLETQKIKSKCKASQGNISSLSGRIKGIQTSRTEVYKNLTDRLTSLSTKLQAKNVDTTKLDGEIKTLQGMIDQFKTDLTNYKQAVTDLKNMDCASDPTAFKASLENARTLRDKLKQSGAAIKTYLNDTIKPTLKEIRTQLEASKPEAETEKSSTTTTTGGQ